MFHSRVIIILISLLNTIPSHVTTLKIKLDQNKNHICHTHSLPGGLVTQ